MEETLEHINKIEEGVIIFTHEKEEDGELSVLDLKQIKNIQTEKLEFKIHYKKTHTNINIKKKSNHPEYVKGAIIKGFVDRAKTLCSEKYIEDELNNIMKVFVANGYSKEEVLKHMNRRERREEEEEPQYKGSISIPYIKGFSEKYRRIMNKQNYRVTFKSTKKVRQIKEKAVKPLGLKQKNLVYRIPCGCKTKVYNGETFRMMEDRQEEHKRKVRLTKDDIANNRNRSAQNRINTVDGRMAKHSSMECTNEIEWENTEILCIEKNSRQRKVREGIESIKGEIKGLEPMNTFYQLEDWKDVINVFEKKGR